MALASQTCDVVRACQARPYLEVRPIVQVGPDDPRQIERGRRPAYAHLPQLATRQLVVDLDRTMTVEKAMVMHWTRVAGCGFIQRVKSSGNATRARLRARACAKLLGRLIEKHDRESPEGRALRALLEIRVRASPSWNHDTVRIMFFFIRHRDDSDFSGIPWSQFLDAWLKLVPAGGRFTPYGQVAELAELTAVDYVNSDPLDLAHLSLPDT